MHAMPLHVCILQGAAPQSAAWAHQLLTCESKGSLGCLNCKETLQHTCDDQSGWHSKASSMGGAADYHHQQAETCTPAFPVVAGL